MWMLCILAAIMAAILDFHTHRTMLWLWKYVYWNPRPRKHGCRHLIQYDSWNNVEVRAILRFLRFGSGHLGFLWIRPFSHHLPRLRNGFLDLADIFLQETIIKTFGGGRHIFRPYLRDYKYCVQIHNYHHCHDSYHSNSTFFTHIPS